MFGETSGAETGVSEPDDSFARPTPPPDITHASLPSAGPQKQIPFQKRLGPGYLVSLG